MRCVQCGREIGEGRNFCGACGAIQTDAEGINENTANPQNNINDFYRRRAAQPIPKKKSKKPMAAAAAVGAVMVITAAVMAVGIFFFGWFGDSGAKNQPEETVKVALRAIDRNDSKVFFNCFKPEIKNQAESALKNATSSFGTMFGGESPNSYKLLDKTLEYFKFILGIDKIDFRQTDTIDGELNSNVKIDGDLYFGTMNMGKISVSLEMIDGIWYISKVDTSALKLDSVLKQFPDAKKLLGES